MTDMPHANLSFSFGRVHAANSTVYAPATWWTVAKTQCRSPWRPPCISMPCIPMLSPVHVFKQNPPWLWLCKQNLGNCLSYTIARQWSQWSSLDGSENLGFAIKKIISSPTKDSSTLGHARSCQRTYESKAEGDPIGLKTTAKFSRWSKFNQPLVLLLWNGSIIAADLNTNLGE